MSLYIPTFAEVLAVSRARGRNSKAPDLWNGLVGYWSMLQGGGHTLYDVSGYDNHGTLTSMDPATDWVGSPYGGALQFDGTNQYVEAAATGPLALTVNDPRTVVLWAKKTADVNNLDGLMLWHGVAGNDGQLLVVYFDQDTRNGILVGQRFSNSYASQPATSVSISEWHQYAFTIGTSTDRPSIYVDGVLNSTIGVALGSWDTGVVQWGRGIGSANHGPFQLVNVLIYNRVLSTNEIRQLYAAPHDMARLRRHVQPAVSAPPAGLDIPIAMHHYKQLQGAN